VQLRDHVLLGGAAALAAAPVLGIRASGVFWLSSVLIDVDHYLDFVYRSRFTEWTPQKMFQFHQTLLRRVHDPDFLGLSLFHTIEWFLLVGIVGAWSGSVLVFAAMLGMVFHLSLDFAYLATHRALTARALSLVEYFIRRRAIVHRGYDPDRVFRETLAAVASARGPDRRAVDVS
jgi:hypothetical protein